MFSHKKIFIGMIILLLINEIIFYSLDQSKWIELIISDVFIILLFFINFIIKNNKDNDNIPTTDERISNKTKHYNHMILLWSYIVLLGYLGYQHFIKGYSTININNLALYISLIIFFGFILSGFLAKKSKT
ncbi:hypothetical protein U0X36_30105 [Bacillus thuringiensis]|uniref:hypothetical protein n=1 Tax=Bacillus thuringiensis TaxID=1428 RepID=UPI000E518D21|nr:hypothetical protein [Bacillus thuringiensis]MDZ3957031.1 hypothetical protein [Bacillus thuringiensis]RGP42981.1 hypothetical protein BTW32_30405 [Bacillus thuringiensis]